MFEFIRKHKETFAILSGIVTAAFFLWNFAAGNISSMFHKSNNCLANVDSECVSIADFRRIAMRTNQPLTPLLKEQILNSLIDDDLLYHQAKKEGFVVSDKEVADIISHDPSFQVNGKFDFDRYKTVLTEAGYTPKSYENYVKKQLTIQKYTVFITNASYVTGAELNVSNLINNTELSGKAYIVTPDEVNIKYTPTEQEIQDYYNKHKDEFKAISQSSIVYWSTTDKNKAMAIYKALQSGQLPPGYQPYDPKTMSQAFGNAIKNLNAKNRVIAGQLGNNIYILTYLSKNNKNAQILPLSQVKNQIIAELTMEKKIEQLKAFAKEAYQSLVSKKPVNLKPVAFNKFSLDRLSAMVSIKPQDVNAMVSAKTPAYFGPYVATNGTAYVILEIDSRTQNPNATKNQEDVKQLEQLKANITMNYLVKYLREHTKVIINKELFKNL